ncbi:Zn(II)2Cys6 transcription factor domain-containing protein [Sporobolomyces salmoneus]|uniref:Zn(II)2Cys6 transcription factor domain-containing protein n=1 Tax=Sporobolomyces salmoneus TaxID=183962 RepID=UPI00317561FD
MTPPIPVGGERKRPSKSCLPCRQAKGKCIGLSEEYLHQIDNNPEFTPDPHTKCTRCTKQQLECTFAPSRRKGRPRRVARGRESNSTSNNPNDDSHHSTPSPSNSPSRSTGSDSFFNPLLTTGDLNARSPSQSTSLSGSLQASPCHVSVTTPPTFDPSLQLPNPLQSTASIESIVEGYLNEIYLWCPILPADASNLRSYLIQADTSLTLALASIIDVTRPPPLFPPTTGYISHSTLQAGVFLSLRAYGLKDRSRAVELIEWVSNEFRKLGWKGHDMEKVSNEVRREEMEQFVGLGYLVWGLTIQSGVLTGNRGLLLAEVQLPAEITEQNMILHAFALLREATDFETLWSLPESERFEYTIRIVHWSDRIQRTALDFLRKTTPPFDPSSPPTAQSLGVAAARETAFLTASIAPAAIILLLSSTSPLSPLIAPALPCSLDTTSYPTGPLSSLVKFAANKVLNVVREAPTREGVSVACQPHSPYWGCCFLVVARGLLLGLEATQLEEQKTGKKDETFDKGRTEEDLDLCEMILKQQAEKWPAAESLMAEVGLLRRTAGIV